MRLNAGMANRQGDVDLRFAQVSAPSYHFGLAWPLTYFIHLPMKMEPIVSSETSAIRTQTPWNYPNRNKLHYLIVLTRYYLSKQASQKCFQVFLSFFVTVSTVTTTANLIII